jgi:hypothetical protein
MKIIVVDDHIDPEQIIRGALASGSAAGSHSVRGVRTPEELDRISDLDTYRLAFVDMSFPEPVKNSGLLTAFTHQARGSLRQKSGTSWASIRYLVRSAVVPYSAASPPRSVIRRHRGCSARQRSASR